MLMREAVGIHMDDMPSVLESYSLLSQQYFTHATPTLFNAGTMRPQMSSCFLLAMKDDSIEGIYDTLKQCAVISKHAGGIGLSISDIRLVIHMSVALMVQAMESYQCCECSMTRLATSTKVVGSAKEA